MKTDILGESMRRRRSKRVAKMHVAEVASDRLRMYEILTKKRSRHGKCSDWVRENRRRRSCGLPQKKVLPFGLGIYDPMNRTITKTFADGTLEIQELPQ